jgi:DNA polymerase (family 10)
VGDLDILVVADDARAIEHVSTLDDVERVLGSGQTKATVILRGGLQVDVRVVPAPSFGAALHYFTGNKAHNIAVRQRARDRGLKLNEYGVFRGERRVAGDTEESVFASVGLPWIPPEMRQNRGEIEAAERGTLPRPVALDDLVTDLVRPSAAHTFEGLARASSRAGRPSLVAVWPPDEPIPGQAEREAVLIATQAPLSSRIARRPGTDLLVASLPVGAKPKTGARAIASAHPELVCFPPTFGLRGDELAGWLGVFEQLAEAGIGILAEASEELLPSLDPVLRTAKTMGVSVLLASGTSTVAGLDALELAVGQARRAWVEAADVLDTLDAQALRRLWA